MIDTEGIDSCLIDSPIVVNNRRNKNSQWIEQKRKETRNSWHLDGS